MIAALLLIVLMAAMIAASLIAKQHELEDD